MNSSCISLLVHSPTDSVQLYFCGYHYKMLCFYIPFFIFCSSALVLEWLCFLESQSQLAPDLVHQRTESVIIKCMFLPMLTSMSSVLSLYLVKQSQETIGELGKCIVLMEKEVFWVIKKNYSFYTDKTRAFSTLQVYVDQAVYITHNMTNTNFWFFMTKQKANSGSVSIMPPAPTLQTCVNFWLVLLKLQMKC